jgi:hypothetical protein
MLEEVVRLKHEDDARGFAQSLQAAAPMVGRVVVQERHDDPGCYPWAVLVDFDETQRSLGHAPARRERLALYWAAWGFLAGVGDQGLCVIERPR